MKVKKKSQKQERDIANKTNGKTVIASGALWGAKGDVRTENYLIEAKTTAKNYYTLNANTWCKIAREALEDGMRTPLMMIDFRDGATRVVVFRLSDFDSEPVGVPLSKPVKSIKLYDSDVGQLNEYYCYRRMFTMQGVDGKLCEMTFSDFTKRYKEVLEWE